MTKIGEMPYLNSEIFYLNKNSEFNYMKLPPKKMGEAISKKNIDAGPISLIDYINIENLIPLENYCVSTKKSANSVFLFSQKKLEYIRNVNITDETSTSVVLLKVLNKFFWKNEGLCCKVENKEDESNLIIGDNALKIFNSNNNYNYVYDLGYEWHKFTGLPFVFALWAFRDLNNNELNDLKKSINLGLNNYQFSLKTIIKNNNRSYLSNLKINDYINGFNYRVENNEEKAIKIFKEMYNELEL